MNENAVTWARHQRLQEIQMWSIIREISLYLCFFSLLCIVIYGNRPSNAFSQVNHLQKYILNSRQTDSDYTKVCSLFGESFRRKNVDLDLYGK